MSQPKVTTYTRTRQQDPKPPVTRQILFNQNRY